MARPWPEEIRLKNSGRLLVVAFTDGSAVELSAELLRVESPSAEVQGHGGDTKKTVAGKRHVAVTGIEPVGNYAVRLIFDDGHDSGLYSWDTLHKLGTERERVWADYLVRLEAEGLARDPTT